MDNQIKIIKTRFQDFKDFAMKGNVLDLAVGVIIGGAFGKIVSSLVGDILMPLIGLVAGKVNLSSLKLEIMPDLVLRYGAFLQSVLDFIIIAASVYLIIKLFEKFKRKQDKVQEATVVVMPTPTRSEELLVEIRDLLKERKDS